MLPYMDLLFAILVLVPRTRQLGAALCTCVLAVGMIVRRFEGKDAVFDGCITFGSFVVWMVLGTVDW